MRLPLITPADLTPEQKPLYDDMKRGIAGNFNAFLVPVRTFGQHPTNEMIYLVGLYCLVSTTLNGFNVPVPERE